MPTQKQEGQQEGPTFASTLIRQHLAKAPENLTSEAFVAVAAGVLELRSALPVMRSYLALIDNPKTRAAAARKKGWEESNAGVEPLMRAGVALVDVFDEQVARIQKAEAERMAKEGDKPTGNRKARRTTAASKRKGKSNGHQK